LKLTLLMISIPSSLLARVQNCLRISVLDTLRAKPSHRLTAYSVEGFITQVTPPILGID